MTSTTLIGDYRPGGTQCGTPGSAAESVPDLVPQQA